MPIDDENDLRDAHAHCRRNRDAVARSQWCGCFYCLAVFTHDHVYDHVNGEQTALCPRCGIDSVLGDASGLSIEDDFLRRMYKHWFGYGHCRDRETGEWVVVEAESRLPERLDLALIERTFDDLREANTPELTELEAEWSERWRAHPRNPQAVEMFTARLAEALKTVATYAAREAHGYLCRAWSYNTVDGRIPDGRPLPPPGFTMREQWRSHKEGGHPLITVPAHDPERPGRIVWTTRPMTELEARDHEMWHAEVDADEEADKTSEPS